MKTTTAGSGILLAALVLLALWTPPVQGGEFVLGASVPEHLLHPQSVRTCDRPIVLTGGLPYSLSGGTWGGGDDYNLGVAGPCDGGGIQHDGTGLGEDEVFVFVTDEDCPISMSMTPQGPHDLALYVLNPNCSSVAANCVWVDDGNGPGGAEELEIMALAGEYYFVVVDGSDGQTGNFFLDFDTSGECSFAYGYGVVGDRLWRDVDRDGIQDAGEDDLNLGLANLYKCGGGPVLDSADLFMDTDYQFGGLLPGEYSVEFVLPSGYNFSPQDRGGNDDHDSDANPDTGSTECFSIGPGTNDRTRDAGAYRETFTLGDRVWYDTNWNGIQDTGEPGLEGTQMMLLSGGCDGSAGPTSTSNASGNYTFGNVAGGTYCIEVKSMPSTPGQWLGSPKGVGMDDTLDSDFIPSSWDTGPFSVSANNLHLDLGAFVGGHIIGKVWCDADGNQVRDAGEEVEKVEVALYSDPECDMTKNGILDRHLTGADGSYDFLDLYTGPPGGPPECYVVEVKPAGLGICNEDLDCAQKPIALDALPPAFSREDFGFRMPAGLSLGDKVWYDTDRDGIQDSGEPGLQGVKVKLFANAGCQGSQQASDTTNPAGFYGFGGLTAGTYCLSLDGGIPEPFYLTMRDEGSNDSLDSDVDQGTRRIENINLSASNLDLDAGLLADGRIEGRVFCDLDGDGSSDADEYADGVTVTLSGDANCDTAGDAALMTSVTSTGGLFSFNPVRVGPPGGQGVCYVLKIDSGDMGGCNIPLTTDERYLALTVDNRNSLNNHVGFVKLPHAVMWIYLPSVLRGSGGQ